MTVVSEDRKREFGKPDGFPSHVAIIMDGNGRWARARGYPRIMGHRRGVEVLKTIVRHAGEIGIEWLTLYAFSSENWSRPVDEVSELMGLLKLFIRRDLAELHQANVRVRIIGERNNLPRDIAGLLDETETTTAANTGLNLVVAFNYGARDEMLRAVRRLARESADGLIDPMTINESVISARLDTAFMPDPDLIIRTSGEQRLSNFLMWQAAYAELVFVPTYWPDMTAAVFDAAIDTYMSRERRFGGLKAKAGS
jgi:undecaprenyl diphosphate synthase